MSTFHLFKKLEILKFNALVIIEFPINSNVNFSLFGKLGCEF